MRLRTMTEQDVPGGLRLNTLCGWNQTAADWLRFLHQSPGGCFVMEHDGTIVGTATTISYAGRFAWIGMVLVDPEYRKQGIGTQLLEKTIEHLDHSHIRTMKLDATPLGRPIYLKLGFVDEYEIERWVLKRSPGNAPASPRPACVPLTPAQLEQVLKLDSELFGANRSSLLRSLHHQSPEFAMAAWEGAAPQGYTFGRRGLFADHLGPWMSRNRTTAEALLQTFLARSSRDTVIVDCMMSNPVSVELLTACGFAPARPLTRMFRGANEYPGRPGLFCSILGPEFG